jgi:hypothetical protein
MGYQQHDTHHAALPVSAAPTQPAAGGRLLTAGLVAAWYASNIGVLLLNMYLLSVYGFVQRAFSNPCASFKRFCTEFVVIVCFHLPPTENHPKGKGQFRRLQLLFRSSKLRRM